MIAVPALPDPARVWALSTLVDLARLLPGPAGQAVDVTVPASPVVPESIAALRARGWGVTARDGSVVVDPALLDLVVAVAGAGGEQASHAADRYGRVPSAEHPLVQAGAEREPVVHEAALALRTAVRHAAGRRPVVCAVPWPDGRRWAAAMTHDLDAVDWWPAFTALRVLELLKRADVGRVIRVLGAALGAIGRDPVWQAVVRVLATEARAGIHSTWFILTGTPTFASRRAGDLTYLVEGSRARRILARTQEEGHELGLHGSFATCVDSERFAAERARLGKLTGGPPVGVRQHYVRMRPGRTQACMRDAGFAWDASYGFPDRNGFRLGVADVVTGWDAHARAATQLDEVPLVWMDRALSKYRGEERPAAWIEDGLDLARRCRAIEGLWVGLWHPNLWPALGFPGAPEAFDSLLQGVTEHDPWMAPLGTIVDWRRRRRAVRVTAMAPDGRPVLSDPDVAIETG